MIRHCVMLKLANGYDDAELVNVMHGLKNVAMRLPGCLGLEYGANIDLESKSPDYPFGFTLDFKDEDALRTYAMDPEHRTLGKRLVALCGGGDRITVFDLDCIAAP